MLCFRFTILYTSVSRIIAKIYVECHCSRHLNQFVLLHYVSAPVQNYIKCHMHVQALAILWTVYWFKDEIYPWNTTSLNCLLISGWNLPLKYNKLERQEIPIFSISFLTPTENLSLYNTISDYKTIRVHIVGILSMSSDTCIIANCQIIVATVNTDTYVMFHKAFASRCVFNKSRPKWDFQTNCNWNSIGVCLCGLIDNGPLLFQVMALCRAGEMFMNFRMYVKMKSQITGHTMHIFFWYMVGVVMLNQSAYMIFVQHCIIKNTSWLLNII